MSPLTLTRAFEILEILVNENDGKNANELFELIRGLSPPDCFISLELQKRLYMMTADFESSFERYAGGVAVTQMASEASS